MIAEVGGNCQIIFLGREDGVAPATADQNPVQGAKMLKMASRMQVFQSVTGELSYNVYYGKNISLFYDGLFSYPQIWPIFELLK